MDLSTCAVIRRVHSYENGNTKRLSARTTGVLLKLTCCSLESSDENVAVHATLHCKVCQWRIFSSTKLVVAAKATHRLEV